MFFFSFRSLVTSWIWKNLQLSVQSPQGSWKRWWNWWRSNPTWGWQTRICLGTCSSHVFTNPEYSICNCCFFEKTKVEKILKGSLDSIPSPSRSREHLNFFIIFFLPNIAGRCQQTFCPNMFCLYTSNQLLVFEFWILSDGIESRLSSKIFFTLTVTLTFYNLFWLLDENLFRKDY